MPLCGYATRVQCADKCHIFVSSEPPQVKQLSASLIALQGGQAGLFAALSVQNRHSAALAAEVRDESICIAFLLRIILQ